MAGDICTRGQTFRDPEDWRDHMPCPGSEAEQLRAKVATVEKLEGALFELREKLDGKTRAASTFLRERNEARAYRELARACADEANAERDVTLHRNAALRVELTRLRREVARLQHDLNEYARGDVVKANRILADRTIAAEAEVVQERSRAAALRLELRAAQETLGVAQAEVARLTEAYGERVSELNAANAEVGRLKVARRGLEECAGALSAIMDWHDYEADPEAYKREHEGWVPLLPWRRAHEALRAAGRQP